MTRKPKFKPEITRVKLNPEQAVLFCACYNSGYTAAIAVPPRARRIQFAPGYRRDDPGGNARSGFGTTIALANGVC